MTEKPRSDGIKPAALKAGGLGGCVEAAEELEIPVEFDEHAADESLAAAARAWLAHKIRSRQVPVEASAADDAKRPES